jgi:hypothetical protein
MLLWMILLLLHLLTYLLGKHWSVEVEKVDPAMLELARATNLVWGELLPEQVILQPVPVEQEMFARESLLMDIRKLEKNLNESGSLTEISPVLEKWCAVREKQLKRQELIGYLEGIRSWMEKASDEGKECHIERLGLVPDGISGFPCIILELSGSPSAMGRCLREVNIGVPGWKLVELDLNKPVAGETWWMLGCCRYGEETIR